MPGLPLSPFPAQLAAGMRRPDAMPQPPKLGEHSRNILGELGYSPAEVDLLVKTA
jgi:crotonobetainyl-CoA:carnitine CoA-transferase CaiB-like acyl-CoA transferase